MGYLLQIAKNPPLYKLSNDLRNAIKFIKCFIKTNFLSSQRNINKEMLHEFVCNNVDEAIIRLLFRIDQRPITADEFRINVWTKHTDKDRVVPSTKIASSFFVELLPNGEIIDRTINA